MAEQAQAASDVIETLLDVYGARLESLVDRIEGLASNIETTQGVLELSLDNERNRIARLELLLSMAGTGLGVCAAVSGFFGMNLLSGLEEARRLFWIVTSASVMCAVGLFGACLRVFRGLGRQQVGRLRDVQALKNVLRQLDTIGLLLSRSDAPNLTGVSSAEAARRLGRTLAGAQLHLERGELRVLVDLLLAQQQQRDRQEKMV